MTRVWIKAGATAHIPFDACLTAWQIDHTDMDLGLLRFPIRSRVEMGDTMLTLHRVIGLTTIHPAAVNADAHPSSRR